jgi:hypothetical protein
VTKLRRAVLLYLNRLRITRKCLAVIKKIFVTQQKLNTMKGLITIQSDYSVKETIDRLASIVESQGLTVFPAVVGVRANNDNFFSQQYLPKMILIKTLNNN